MTPTEMVELERLADETLFRQARGRLEDFVSVAWPILEPGTPFKSTWLVGYLAEYLEAISAGQLHRVVINMPPRHGKSLLVSVLWPVWEWLRQPSRRWMMISANDALARRLSRMRRGLIQHPTIEARVPTVRLVRAAWGTPEFENVSCGIMTATSMGGPILGKGASRIVLDDPQTMTDVLSDALRRRQEDLFRKVISTRLDDKARDALVVVQQRLHVEDLSGYCLGQGFHPVVLPALETAPTVYVFPRSGQRVAREPDTALWPEREDRTTLEMQRQLMGSYAFNAQYLQAPEDTSGGFFAVDDWGFYDLLPDGGHIVQTWDLTLKGGPTNDFVVGLVALRDKECLYILDRFKKRATFTETKAAMRAMLAKYPTTTAVLVEDAANGAAIVDDLKAEIPGLVSVSPEGGKQARAVVAQARVQARQILLPNPRTASGLHPDRAWVEDFIATAAAFPRGKHDDDVDALSQLAVYCQQHPWLVAASFACQPDDEVRQRTEEQERRADALQDRRRWMRRQYGLPDSDF